MTYAKAIVAALLAGLSALAAALNDGTVTMSEWVTVASATLVALAAVWRVPNAAGPPPPVPPITTSTSGNVKVIPRDESGGTPTPPD